MKKFLILLFMCLAVTTVNAQADTSQLNGKITIEVEGLACPFCAYGLEKNLKEIDGVENIEINIEKGSVLLAIEEGKQISENLILQKIKDAGFTPGKLKKDSDE